MRILSYMHHKISIFVGATIMALVGSYAGGVISSGTGNWGDWERKDWMWVGIAAASGFIAGYFGRNSS